MDEATTLVHEGFFAECDRGLYNDVAYSVIQLILSPIDKDLSLLPPGDMTGKSGRPDKGREKGQGSGQTEKV